MYDLIYCFVIDKIRENGFELTKRRSKRYPAKTITDADYADDLALLANITLILFKCEHIDLRPHFCQAFLAPQKM